MSKYKIINKNYSFIVWIQLFLIPILYPFRNFFNRLLGVNVTLLIYAPFLLIMFGTFVSIRNFFISKWSIVLIIYYILFLPYSMELGHGFRWILGVFIGAYLGGIMYKYEFNLDKVYPAIWGIIICSILFLPNIINMLPLKIDSYTTYRIPNISGDIDINPNAWGQLLVISILICFTNFWKSKRKSRVWRCSLVILCFFLLLSKSRTSIYSLFFAVGVFILLTMVNRMESWNTKLAIFSFLSLSIVMALVLFPYQLENNSRVLNFNLNGRNMIWDIILNVIKNRMDIMQLLFGTGTGGTATFIYDAGYDLITKSSFDTEGYLSAHNMYLDSFISSGLVGTLIVVLYWIKSSVVLIRNKSIYLVFPVSILIMGIGSHLFSNLGYMISIIITEYALYEIGYLRNKCVIVKY